MSHPAVEIHNLGKKYAIQKKVKPDSIRELLTSSPLGWHRGEKTKTEEFWALKDVSFEVRPGETFGIIGRNGAGKSTLLKILSRVVSPTTGKATINGKTASLLEVGTGFHPQLSGRENVYFNGALLGMSKAEIARKFNDIVDFSEVGAFIDNPVKLYSSGMRARLAFSVAAHLEAEIMIIDEALAAGDAIFRQKAEQKMKEAAFNGRSVLFVTHSIGSAAELCNRALYLKNGRQVMIGETKQVIEEYLGTTKQAIDSHWKAPKSMELSDKRIIPKEITLYANGKPFAAHTPVTHDKTLEVALAAEIAEPHETMAFGFSLFDDQNRRLYRSEHIDLPKERRPKLKPGVNKLIATIPTDYLKSGRYVVAMDADVYKGDWLVRPGVTEARVEFTLRDNPAISPWDPGREGIIKPALDWRNAHS